MITTARIIAAVAFAATPTFALADGYPATPLFITGKTTIGEDIVYPTSGKARVNASIVAIAPGEATILHRHGVPMFAFILEGEVTVDYGDHGKKTYRAGEAFMEAMDVNHKGFNTGAIPVKILAVYMGAEGAKDVIPSK